jgi:hypothetical protein
MQQQPNSLLNRLIKRQSGEIQEEDSSLPLVMDTSPVEQISPTHQRVLEGLPLLLDRAKGQIPAQFQLAMGMVQGLLEKSLTNTSEEELQASLVFIDSLVYFWRTGEKPEWVTKIEQLPSVTEVLDATTE